MCFFQRVFLVTIGSFTYAYASSIIGTTLAQPSFISYFDMDTRSNAAQISGAINGVFQAGCLIGALACIPITDKYGRRMAVSIAGMLGVLGGALQAASVHIVMYLVMRVVSGLGLGMTSSSGHAAIRQNTNRVNNRCFGYNGASVSCRGSRPRDSRPHCRHHWYHDCGWLYKRKLDWLRLLLCSWF